MGNQGVGGNAADTLRKGDRLPSIRLDRCFRKGELALRPSRGARVLIVLHRPDCDECIAYLTDLEPIREPLESWGADMVVVSPEPILAADPLLARLGVPVLEDRNHVLSQGRLRVLIADEWGEVYFASEPQGAHATVALEEVVEWVKFISIQCPECEGPEGEWRNL